MRTIGLKPQDRVLVIERREDDELLHNALVTNISMDETLTAANGQMAIDVVVVTPPEWHAVIRFVSIQNVHHISHPKWRQGSIGFAYELLPPQSGVCRFCGCTEQRACIDSHGDACSWIDVERTVCSRFGCIEKASELREELLGMNLEVHPQ